MDEKHRGWADRLVRWTTTGCVVVLAGIAAVISYKHMFVLSKIPNGVAEENGSASALPTESIRGDAPSHEPSYEAHTILSEVSSASCTALTRGVEGLIPAVDGAQPNGAERLDRAPRRRRRASGLQRRAWQWALTNRTPAGELPSGKGDRRAVRTSRALGPPGQAGRGRRKPRPNGFMTASLGGRPRRSPDFARASPHQSASRVVSSSGPRSRCRSVSGCDPSEGR